MILDKSFDDYNSEEISDNNKDHRVKKSDSLEWKLSQQCWGFFGNY